MAAEIRRYRGKPRYPRRITNYMHNHRIARKVVHPVAQQHFRIGMLGLRGIDMQAVLGVYIPVLQHAVIFCGHFPAISRRRSL